MMVVSLDGLHPTLMRPRVEALLADPDAIALGIFVVSGFRSIEHQTRLWSAALAKYGDPEVADNWVARPGTSNHGPKVDGFGVAVDLGVRGVQSLQGQWPDHVEHAVNVVAERHGLRSPMSWEDWHFEPISNWSPIPPLTNTPSTTPTLFLSVYSLIEESVMAVFKDDADREVWFVRSAYLELLGRQPESPEFVMMWIDELRRHGGDYVWSRIADSDEGQFVRDRRRAHLGLDG